MFDKSKKGLITSAWLILVFSFLSYHFLTEEWDKMNLYLKKNTLINFKSQMYDKYLSKYVDGVM